jgi:hypothetical protein
MTTSAWISRIGRTVCAWTCRAEAAAKLALDCANADELEARLSALCGILGDLQLPI